MDDEQYWIYKFLFLYYIVQCRYLAIFLILILSKHTKLPQIYGTIPSKKMWKSKSKPDTNKFV